MDTQEYLRNLSETLSVKVVDEVKSNSFIAGVFYVNFYLVR